MNKITIVKKEDMQNTRPDPAIVMTDSYPLSSKLDMNNITIV
jgi:hypothetical protein